MSIFESYDVNSPYCIISTIYCVILCARYWGRYGYIHISFISHNTLQGRYSYLFANNDKTEAQRGQITLSFSQRVTASEQLSLNERKKKFLVDIRAQAINSFTVRYERKYVTFCNCRTEDRDENLEIISGLLIWAYIHVKKLRYRRTTCWK